MAIYNGKHCVFEEIGLETNTYRYNSNANLDSDNCYNDYDISQMRNTHLPNTILPKLSSALQDNLTATTIQTAKNGLSSTLVSTSDKLFLAAVKEMGGSTHTTTQELNALITWQYYVLHNTNADRKKERIGGGIFYYYLRSPYLGSSSEAVVIDSNGGLNTSDADTRRDCAPCFAF